MAQAPRAARSKLPQMAPARQTARPLQRSRIIRAPQASQLAAAANTRRSGGIRSLGERIGMRYGA